MRKRNPNEIDVEFIKRLKTAYVLLPHRRKVLRKMLAQHLKRSRVIAEVCMSALESGVFDAAFEGAFLDRF